MERMEIKTAIKPPTQKIKVRAPELSSLLDHYPTKITTLSLDCFDTLLWRKTATPIDVFYDLQQTPLFQSLQITARLRIQAETFARQKMALQDGTNEVTLNDIYRLGFPALRDEEYQDLIETEMTMEMAACYAFPPMIELIRAANSRGLKIVIVSDTYFAEKQLRRLLENALPKDMLSMIRKIFCSCEYRKSKSLGLFKNIVEQVYAAPNSILHIGDNIKADFTAPISHGVNALHFIHHNNDVVETTRMQALAGGLLDPKIRNIRSLNNPFRGVLASDSTLAETPEGTIGYAAIGPIMYAFGRFICDEIEQMRRDGQQPKIVFLLRDAYLPSLVCEALAGHELGKRVRISRFTALACSFRTKENVDTYLADKITSNRFQDMSKQLLLSHAMIASLMQSLEKAKNPAIEFKKFIHQQQTLRYIFKESAAYFGRLKQHLENEIGLQRGDTLLFIDLGYTGTAQIKLEPVFRDEMDVKIIGRYLISLPMNHLNSSRRGLLDLSSYDDKSLIMLVSYIAIIEQICTTTENSVVDFDNQGKPIYSDASVSEQQNNKVLALQSECLRFIRDAEIFIQTAGLRFTDAMLRDAAALSLSRLIFLPTKSELDYMQSFQFDFNLGTNEILPVFDINKGITGLRRRGWLHSSKENIQNMRTNYPAEWRAASLELSVTLMAQHRFGLEFSVNDISHRREFLHVIAMLDQQLAPPLVLEATPTYDGFFSLMVPVVNVNCQLAIRFGRNYHWVELESAELIKMTALYSHKEFENTVDANANLSVDQMGDKGGGLFECQSDASVIVFVPPKTLENSNHILRIIFRPIVFREVQQGVD